ncbi:hypothetical protein [Kitasatospora sp. NPDC087315]|uniref:hypothetical protein n=1 Tax=Kitasatospora sp. NPDC087315 TaxID=3364069 RepID=UPI003805A3BC
MSTGGRPRRGRLPVGRALPVALGLAVAAAGAVGYLDWRAHQPAEEPGRAARLCGLSTGDGTPLGRLLPPGAQDVEEREANGYGGPGPRSCVIRVDGRTALTVTAARHEGSAALSPTAAGQPDAHGFGAGSLSASWARGAAVADYCPGKDQPVGHVRLEVTAGAAARVGRAELESVARDALAQQRKDVCG